jgi:glycosyltransferase involved in cell wall biosynthesis
LHAEPYSPARVRNIREADAVVANNDYLGRLLREKMRISPAGTIHDGIDRRYFFPPQTGRAQRDSVTVLYAGSFRPYKRVPLVVRQAALWPQVRFRIAGIGEDEQICRNLAAELGCRNVEFLGHLSLPQLGEEMRRADIFFFPSILEGHPQVLGQAAACRLPAIAMRVYRPDYVVDGVTGFLVDSDAELVNSPAGVAASHGRGRRGPRAEIRLGRHRQAVAGGFRTGCGQAAAILTCETFGVFDRDGEFASTPSRTGRGPDNKGDGQATSGTYAHAFLS